MTKSIADRIRDSFEGDDGEHILKYLEWLRSVSADYSQSIRRLATVLIFLAASFELVANSRNTEITIGSFHLTRGSVVLIFLPALVSYLYLQIASDTVKGTRVFEAFNSAEKIWTPKAEENNLDYLLLGPQPIFINPFSGWISQTHMRSVDKLEDRASGVFLVIYHLGVLAFSIQAYYVLFSTRITVVIIWSISLCVTFFCLTFGILLYLAGASED